MVTVHVWLGATLGVIAVACAYKGVCMLADWMRAMVRAEVQAELSRATSGSMLYRVSDVRDQRLVN